MRHTEERDEVFYFVINACGCPAFIVEDFDTVNYWRFTYPECIVDSGKNLFELCEKYGISNDGVPLKVRVKLGLPY